MDVTREPDERRPERALDIHVASAPSEGRVRAALRCPYCHDQVSRAGAVGCARAACGALYHRECWDEVARWDGCAALGCGSREAREVSAVGYLVRVARLLLAALLFPRRVVRRLRAQDEAGALSIYRRALDMAWVALPSRDASRNGPVKLFLIIASVVPAAFLVACVAAWTVEPEGDSILKAFLALSIFPLWVGFPFLVALAGALVLHAGLAVGRAFRRELAALARAEAPVRSAPKPTGK